VHVFVLVQASYVRDMLKTRSLPELIASANMLSSETKTLDTSMHNLVYVVRVCLCVCLAVCESACVCLCTMSVLACVRARVGGVDVAVASLCSVCVSLHRALCVGSNDTALCWLRYENYNKFISATDTIRQMKESVGSMDAKMESLVKSMEAMTESSAVINGALKDNRSKVRQGVGVGDTLGMGERGRDWG
jgi:hypothetical protein